MTETRQNAYKQLELTIASLVGSLSHEEFGRLCEAYIALYNEEVKMEDDLK